MNTMKHLYTDAVIAASGLVLTETLPRAKITHGTRDEVLSFISLHGWEKNTLSDEDTLEMITDIADTITAFHVREIGRENME